MHSPGTLILRLGGKDAIKATIFSILSLLKLTGNDVLALYRLENPFLWFIRHANDRVKAQINKKTFGFDNSMKVEVAPLEEEKVKVTLHWVTCRPHCKKESRRNFFLICRGRYQAGS